jgi:PAS domain S-box-containing protein
MTKDAIDLRELSLADIQELFQQLQSRQVELEAENDRLQQATKRLEESFDKYRDLYDYAPVGYFTLNKEGVIVETNLAGAELLGRPRQQLIQQPLAHFVTPSGQEKLVVHCLQVYETQSRQVCELELVRQDGVQIDARVESIPATIEGSLCHCRTAISLISEQKRTEKMLAQRNRELELLNMAGQTIVSSLNTDEILTTILEGIRHILDVIACSVWLVDSATNELVCRQVTAPQNEIVLGWRLAPGQGLAGWVVEHGELLNVPDAQVDERHFKTISEQVGLKLRSILTVPLRIKQNIIGVIQVIDQAANRFDAADLRLVESLAATAAVAIDNAKLYERAVHDAETKAMLLNEVNHRVRNNLGIIIGLLYLEQQYVDEQERDICEPVMQELAVRVQGLATVHDLLSASEWTPLPLMKLARQIVYACLQTLTGNKHITLRVTPSPIEITPNQAHSLALIINELATNAVKYAWPGQDKGQIYINSNLEDDMVVFEFRDDGQGYPEDVIKRERANIGFELISNIVRRGLKGEISLGNEQGAVTTIRFKPGD